MPKNNEKFENYCYEPGDFTRDAAAIAEGGAILGGAFGAVMTLAYGIYGGFEFITDGPAVGSDLIKAAEFGTVTAVSVLALKGLSVFLTKQADKLQED